MMPSQDEPAAEDSPQGVLVAPTLVIQAGPEVVQVTLYLHVGSAIDNPDALKRLAGSLNAHAVSAVCGMLAH